MSMKFLGDKVDTLHIISMTALKVQQRSNSYAPKGFMKPGLDCWLLKEVCNSAGPAMMLSTASRRQRLHLFR